MNLLLDKTVVNAKNLQTMQDSNLKLAPAVLLMFITIASFVVMAVAGRYVSDELDTFEILMYRSLLGLIIISTFVIMTGKQKMIQIALLKYHLLRNILHFGAQNLWFFAITVIPLVQVFALEFSVPIWILVLSPLFLKESFTKPRAFAAIMGFVGILLITRPNPEIINLGIIAAGLAALGFAGSIMITKILTQQQNTLTILFVMTVSQLVFAIIFSGYDLDIAYVTGTKILWLLAIGIAGLMAHLCMTKALSLAPASVVAPIDFLRLPVIAVVGYMLFNETVDSFLFYGIILIFVGNYVNILAERSK